MDKVLLDAFLGTNYLVCINEVEWASVRIGLPLPERLQQLVGERCWGYVTAWNPRSQALTEEENTAAQGKLAQTLRAQPETTIHPAIGLGRSGWSEPSLFVIGPGIATLDALCNHYRQHAYVHGRAGEPAQLRLLQP